MSREKSRFANLKIESYEGENTFFRCGDDTQDYLFAVITIAEDGSVEVIDNGYRSHAEALKSWPEAGDAPAPNRD